SDTGTRGRDGASFLRPLTQGLRVPVAKRHRGQGPPTRRGTRCAVADAPTQAREAMAGASSRQAPECMWHHATGAESSNGNGPPLQESERRPVLFWLVLEESGLPIRVGIRR